MSLPTTMRATVVDNFEPKVKSGVPLPKLNPGDILIKTKAVAANPIDWKQFRYHLCGTDQCIIGVDVAGEIVQMDDGVDSTKFHIGDFVYGFVHGSNRLRTDNGAFAEYVAIDSKLALVFDKKNNKTGEDVSLLEGPIDSMEAAASVTSSLCTAAATVFYHVKAKIEWEPKKVQIKGSALLWGGSTALGQYLIQLLKHFNVFEKIVVVASKKHEEQLKKYGADEVYDYHDQDVLDQIKSSHNDFAWLFDCVSTVQTFNQVYECAPKNSKANVFYYMPLTINDIRPELRRDDITLGSNNLFNATGLGVQMGDAVFPPNLEYRNIIVKFLSFINKYLNNGSIHRIPIKLYENGLESTIHMMQDLEDGKVSNQKLVATLP